AIRLMPRAAPERQRLPTGTRSPQSGRAERQFSALPPNSARAEDARSSPLRASSLKAGAAWLIAKPLSDRVQIESGFAPPAFAGPGRSLAGFQLAVRRPGSGGYVKMGRAAMVWPREFGPPGREFGSGLAGLSCACRMLGSGGDGAERVGVSCVGAAAAPAHRTARPDRRGRVSGFLGRRCGDGGAPGDFV